VLGSGLSAQDTLPHFTMVERGGRVTISWVNPFETLVQLNVQRSFDSIKFSTVYSATSPQLPQNGFTDVKMPTNQIFYRIFYVLGGGKYFFSEVRRVGSPANYTSSRDVSANFMKMTGNENRMVTIQIKESISRQIAGSSFRAFRDSVLKLTKDTLIAVNDSLVLLNPYIVREAFRTSSYVFLSRDGYINVSLPLINERKYRLKFFEENGALLFEINQMRESPLILDKANFVHAGWFLFELYEDNKLKEKNRLYLPKDF
jgi:hypothetical protein